MIEQKNPELHNAIRIGLVGMACVCLGIVWVFVGSDAGMFGPAEALAVVGMLMIMGAAWKAADATIGDER